jgi:hypothetical protein
MDNTFGKYSEATFSACGWSYGILPLTSFTLWIDKFSDHQVSTDFILEEPVFKKGIRIAFTRASVIPQRG